MQSVTVSVPGKLILMGEHAAVYRRPALVAAVGRWMRIDLAPDLGTGVAIQLPEMGHAERISWPEVIAYATSARQRWEAFMQQESGAAFAEVRRDDPAYLVKVALGEVMQHLERTDGPPCRLQVTSEQPPGAGFGSSAAVAVGVGQTLLTALNAPYNEDGLYRLALDVERRQHGTPSGIDPVTVLHGGILWVEPNPDGPLRFAAVTVRSPALDHVKVYHSGAPAESTGAVVAQVRERITTAPARYASVLDRMAQATCTLRTLMESRDASSGDLVASIRKFERCLEVLGVVPEPVQEIIRAVEARGGAAKISGAGALTGTGAGSLLVYHPEPERIDRWPFLKALPLVPGRLGVHGARREVPA